MPENKPNRLGKGIDALLGRRQADEAEIRNVDVKKIRPNPFQPRRDFDEQALAELAASVDRHGVVQPVVLREEDDLMATYELVAGERRWRAAQMAGLPTIPAVVRQLDDEAMLAVSLIENLQRQDLSPLEEAWAYDELTHRFDLTQADVAERVGKSRSHVANTVRLLKLAQEVQELLVAGKLTAGHTRAMLVLPPDRQVVMAREAVRYGWSVRETERRCKAAAAEGAQAPAPKAPADLTPEDAELASLATRLGERLGTSVTIRGSEEKGAIVIDYFAAEDLERLLALLGVLDETP